MTEFLQEKFGGIVVIIDRDLTYTKALSLKNKINTAFTPLAGDGDVIAVDDETGRLLQGRLGNPLNRVEAVIKEDTDIPGNTVEEILGIMEEIRLYYGKKIQEADRQAAQQIRGNF